MTSRVRFPLTPVVTGPAAGLILAAGLVAFAIAFGAPAIALAAPAAGAAVVEVFDRDPLAGQSALPWFAEGEAAARFTYLAGAPPAFPGDRPGALRVLYDTTL